MMHQLGTIIEAVANGFPRFAAARPADLQLGRAMM